MPPKRTTRSAAPAAPAASSSTSTRTSRSRKAAPPSPVTSEQESEGGVPGEEDEEEEEEKPVVKPTRRSAKPAKAAPAPKKTTATATSSRTRKSARQSAASEVEAEEDAAEEEQVEVVKPTKRGGRKAAAVEPVAAAKTTRRGAAKARASVVEEEEPEEVDAEVEAEPPAVAEPEADEEEDMEDMLPPPPKGRGSKGKRVSRPAEEAPSEASDEETVGDYKTAKVEQTPSTVFDSAFSNLDTPAVESSDVVPVAVPAIVETDTEEDDEEGDETVRLDAPPRVDQSVPATPLARRPSTNPQGQASSLRPEASSSTIPIPVDPTPKGPTPRLTIHKLVLVNFKSYAGRQEIGPFHKSFSAIVGPNGSGKSNTIDALLFVFGYRASKMRQGKLSELIHNSAGKEGLETCSVEVWFREIVDLPGKDKFLLVPNSQLVVTRTAFRNNSSKYSINDRTSSFTEVTTLLKAKGIDLDHNRFLILQGEVESIALMKPKAQTEHEDGLLEYLEDIIGTTKYKEPIEQADQEREALDEQRAEKMNRLRVVEREKSALEEKKREAEDFLRDTNELTRKKSLLWQVHMHTLQNNLDITAKAIETLTAQLSSEQEANAHHLAEIESLQKEYDEKLATFEEVKQFADKLVKDSKKYEKEEVGLSEKKKHLGAKAKKIKKSVTDDGHARSEALASIENYTSELDKNRVKVADLEAKLEVEEAELEEVRDSLKDKTDVFTSQIETKQRELEPWTAKISEKQSAIDVATSERDLLVQKASGAQSALEEAIAFLDKAKQSDGSKQEEYASLKKERVKVERAIKEADAKVADMASRAEQLRAKASSSRAKADEARSSLAADKSENAVLASLNKLKAQGRIKGFHGRLGDLGVIDDKYDVAVTTACGALNNLVVDTVEQGQACIEHLRKGNVGRASFMVLEKLPPRDLQPIETPENVHRLFDLIKPKDPRFAPAFYKGVFNTLVADDMTQAQRIGYGKKRWRVVTLGGQLIDPSGTMSGGGQRVQRGGMSSKFAADKVAPEVVARYEAESASAQDDFASFQNERRVAEQDLTGLKKRLPEIEMTMEKIELDVVTGEKRIVEAESRLKELKAQSKPDAADEKRIKSLDSEISSLTTACDKLRSQSSSISDEIKSLQQKILDVGGVKLRAIQSRVSTTKGLLDLANEAITKAEVGQAKAERDAEKLGKAIESNKAKLDEAEAELATVQGDLDAVSSDLATIRAKVQEAVDASADVQETLAESKAELDGKSGAVNAFRKLEMDIKQKIEDNGRVQKDSRDKLKHWRKRHDELELSYVDEDEEEEDDQPGESEAVGEGEEEDVKPEVENDSEAEEGDEGQARSKAKGKSAGKKRKYDSMELVEFSADELRSVDKEMLNAEITQLEEDIGRAKPNLSVLNEYRKREAEYLERASDMETVTSARDAAKQRYDELRNVRLKEFMAGFHAISAKLKEMYQMITMGGNAEIELIDSMDPFSEGVVLSIMPPKKSWRAIANLSGGEKTLASLALVFALHVFKPTPLYFMDEIDAALDFKNVSIVANYIQSKTQAAQFIVISLRNDMFELAHRLVGIYKTSNCTKSIAIDNKELKTQALTPAQIAQLQAQAQAQAARRGLIKGSSSMSMASPFKAGYLPGPTPLPSSASAMLGPGSARFAGMMDSPSRAPRRTEETREGSIVPPTPSTVRG